MIRCITALCLALLATTGAWRPVSAEVLIDDLVAEMAIREGQTAVRDFPGWREPQKILVRASEAVVDQMRRSHPAVRFISVSNAADANANIEGADALLGFCNRQVVEGSGQLVWVQIFSAGAERCLAVDAVRDGKVLLTNMQKMSSPVIGEHAIALTLALGRRLGFYAKAMSQGRWEDGRNQYSSMRSVAGKTMLIAGLGGIGTEVGRRAAALGMRVVATRRSSREGPEFVSYVGLSNELRTLAAEADVVVNALPLTDETRGLFDAEFFAATKQGAFFINVGRGGSVVTDDLVEALESGQLGGAGLDVTEPEPLPPSHPLWRAPNTLITPHVATADSDRERRDALLLENVRRFIAGDALLNVVDPAQGY